MQQAYTALDEIKFVIEPQVRPCCRPLFFSNSRETAKSISANGTFGLIDTGERKLLVTCHHVWTEFQKRRALDSNLTWFLCLDRANPVVFNPGDPIDQDERLDIATFDMGDMLPACRGLKFYPLNRNPAPVVKKKDLLVFVGYPGQFRTTTDKSVEFGNVTFAIYVSDANRFSVVSDMTDNVSLFEKQFKQINAEYSYGGISGSPCFLVRADKRVHLMGFVHSYSESLKLLQITHARCINPDGSISEDCELK
jgi:hypothetical protein